MCVRDGFYSVRNKTSQSTSLKKYGRYGAVPLRRAEMGRNICSKEGREREVLRRKGVWNAVKKKAQAA